MVARWPLVGPIVELLSDTVGTPLTLSFFVPLCEDTQMDTEETELSSCAWQCLRLPQRLLCALMASAPASATTPAGPCTLSAAIHRFCIDASEMLFYIHMKRTIICCVVILFLSNVLFSLLFFVLRRRLRVNVFVYKCTVLSCPPMNLFANATIIRHC